MYFATDQQLAGEMFAIKVLKLRACPKQSLRRPIHYRPPR